MSATNSSASNSTGSTRRLLLWTGSILGTLAVLLVVAALVVPRFFTSEQLKGYVIPPLEEATGRQVEIGTIGLRVLPFPAIRVSGFELANVDGYGPEPGVEAEALNVDLSLWPLLVGRIRPKAISLVHPVVRYEVDEQGATNFDDFGGASDPAETAESPFGEIPVSDFRTTGAELQYLDRRTGRRLRANFDAQLSAVPDGPALTSEGTVDFGSLQAVLPERGPDTLSVRDATANYHVRYHWADGRLDVQRLRLETAPLTVTANGALSGLNDGATIDLGFETGATDLGQIAALLPAAAVDGLNPQGTLDLRGSVSGVLPDSAHGLDALTIDGTGRLAATGLDYQGRALLRDLSADLALSTESVSLSSITGQLLGASLEGTMDVRDPLGEPQLDLEVETGPMNLEELVAFVPPEQVGSYSPQGTLQLHMRAEGPLPLSTAALEKTTISGAGQLARFGADYDGAELLRDLNAALDLSGDAASARSINGRLLGKPVSGEMTVRDVFGAPQLDGRLAGGADLAQLAAIAEGDEGGPASVRGTAEYDLAFSGPLENPDDIRPSGRVSLTNVAYPYESFRHPLQIPNATVQLTGTGLSTDQFAVRSGEQTMAVESTVRNLFPLSTGLDETDPAMSVEFTFLSDRLDLVALYPEADTSEPYYSQLVTAELSGSRIKGQSPDAIAETIYGDVELPRFDATGRVEIGMLLNDPQQFDDLTFDVRLTNRRLEVQNLTASTYGGDLMGSITFDQREVDAEDELSSGVEYDLVLSGGRAGSFAEDWTALGRIVNGTLDLKIAGSSPLGAGLLPIPNRVAASGNSLVADGGFSLELGVPQVLMDRLGLPALPVKKFRQFGGPFTIRDGRMELRTWTLGDEATSAQVTGVLGLGGSVNLTMRMDLPLKTIQDSKIPGLAGTGDGALSRVVDKLAGRDAGEATIPLEIRIGGTMREPTVQILNRDAIRLAIEKIAREAGLEILRGVLPGGGR